MIEHLSAAPSKNPDEKLDPSPNFTKFIIMRINNKNYACRADLIREIVMDARLFHTPFAPAYIRGLINRRGEPYMVFDLNRLFQEENTGSATFLISNIDNDHIAFLISDIVDIVTVSEDKICQLKPGRPPEDIYQGALTSKDYKILIFNFSKILAKLRNDIETC